MARRTRSGLEDVLLLVDIERVHSRRLLIKESLGTSSFLRSDLATQPADDEWLRVADDTHCQNLAAQESRLMVVTCAEVGVACRAQIA